METHVHKISCLDCRLAELCLPFGLKKEEITQLNNIIKTKRPIRLDDYLYRQGDLSHSLFAVKSGSFRIFISSLDGVEQTIGFYLPGELMGLDSLETSRYTCSAVALETSMVCELPIVQLNELALKIPSLHNQFLRTIGREIASDHDKIALGHRSAKEKMASFLLMLSCRYHALGFSGSEFNLTMTRQDIANFLGLSVETVSRQITELTKVGIISVKLREIKITDRESLEAIVEPCLANHIHPVYGTRQINRPKGCKL